MKYNNSDNRKKTKIGVLVVLCAVVVCGFVVSRSKSSFQMFRVVDAGAESEGEAEEFEAVRYKAGGPKEDDTVLDKTTPTPEPTVTPVPEDDMDLDPPEDDYPDEPEEDFDETDDAKADENSGDSGNSGEDTDSTEKAPEKLNTSYAVKSTKVPVKTPDKTPVKATKAPARPQTTKKPAATKKPQQSQAPVRRHITAFTVSGSLSMEFPVGHEVSAQDFSGIKAVATWSDGYQEMVVYGMYQVNIDCSTPTGTSKRYAVFSYQGLESAVSVPYGVVQYAVTLSKSMQIPETRSVLSPDGKEIVIPAKTFGAGSYTLLADGDKKVNLSESFSNYLKEINQDKKNGFYTTYQRQDGTSVYTFSGWMDAQGNVYTDSYRMGDEKEVTLYPVFHRTGESYGENANPEQYIIMSTKDGENVLTGYRGTSKIMDVPAGVTCIDFENLFQTWGEDTPVIEKICIPDSVTTLNLEYNMTDADTAEHLAGCREIYVVPENETYSSYEGVLYDKKGATLLKVPSGKADMPEWNENCTKVASLAFSHTSIKSLVIPEKITEIATDGKESFTTQDAALTSVAVKAEKGLKLGAGFFRGESLETSRAYLFQAEEPIRVELSEKGCLPLIYVPDSTEDEVYTAYLCSLGNTYTKALKERREKTDVTSYICTASGAQNRHRYEDSSKSVWSLEDEGKLEKVILGGSQTVDLNDYGTVTELGKNVFLNGDKVRILQIPSTVEKLADEALSGLKNLHLVQMEGKIPPQAGKQVFGANLDKEFYVRVPDSSDGLVLGQYLSMWKQTVDEDYGAGTTERILGVGDLSYYQEEDGVRYLIHENGEQELMEVVDKSIQKLVLPDNTTAIAGNALKDCSSLEILCLPEGIRYLGSAIFKDCENLSIITVNGGNIKTEADTFEGMENRKVKVAVPTTQKNNYESVWKNTGLSFVSYGEKYDMADDMIYADSGEGRTVFYTAYYKTGEQSYRKVAPAYGTLILTADHCSERNGITRINLDVNHMILASGNFANCVAVTDVEVDCMPDAWGKNLFAGSGVQNLKIRAAGKEIILPQNFMKDCETLATVRIEGRVQAGTEVVIPDGCFSGCSQLRLFEIADERTRDCVTKIGKDSFKGCSNLLGITLGRKVSEIATDAFAGCTSLQEIASYSDAISATAFADSANLCINYFADTLKEGMFDGFTGLTAFNLYTSAGKIEIPDNCFRNCTNLRSVDIIHRSVVRRIGNDAFKNTLLQGMTIPESVEEIGAGAFAGCPLATLTFEGGISNVAQIGSRIFGDGQNLTELFRICVPEVAKEAYWKAWNEQLDREYTVLTENNPGAASVWLAYTQPVSTKEPLPTENAAVTAQPTPEEASTPEPSMTPEPSETPDVLPQATE